MNDPEYKEKKVPRDQNSGMRLDVRGNQKCGIPKSENEKINLT